MLSRLSRRYAGESSPQAWRVFPSRFCRDAPILKLEVVHLFRAVTTGKAYDLQPPRILKAPSSSGIGILATWRFQVHPPVATLGFQRLCFRAGKTELPSSPQRSQSWELVQQVHRGMTRHGISRASLALIWYLRLETDFCAKVKPLAMSLE